MLVQTRIASLLLDPNSGLPVVVLIEVGGDRALPIVIGAVEAEAIALALQRTRLERPRTHDLLRSVLEKLDGHLEQVVITALRDSTFYAMLHLRKGGERIVVDCRPSDAMALACRTGADIFVEEAVLEEAHIRPQPDPEEQPPKPVDVDLSADPADLADVLANLTPEDFGKYKM